MSRYWFVGLSRSKHEQTTEDRVRFRPPSGGRPGSRPLLQARWTAARRAIAPSGASRRPRERQRTRARQTTSGSLSVASRAVATHQPLSPVSPGPAGPRSRTHQNIGSLTAPTRLTHVDALVRWRASPCARLSRRRPARRRRRRGRVREHRRTAGGSPRSVGTPLAIGRQSAEWTIPR